MGKIDLFSITLNKNCEFFYSGELLSGKINVTLKKPIKVKYIKLYVKGVVELYWYAINILKYTLKFKVEFSFNFK